MFKLKVCTNKVAIVKFNNDEPESLKQFIATLQKTFVALITNPKVKVILLQPQTTKSFITGSFSNDIQKFNSIEKIQESSVNFQLLLQTISSSPKPFIAAISGLAVNFGLEIALSCHFRIVFHEKGTKLGFSNIFLSTRVYEECPHRVNSEFWGLGAGFLFTH